MVVPRLLPFLLVPAYVAVTWLPFDLEPRHTIVAQPYLLTFAAVAAVWLYRKSQGLDDAAGSPCPLT